MVSYCLLQAICGKCILLIYKLYKRALLQEEPTSVGDITLALQGSSVTKKAEDSIYDVVWVVWFHVRVHRCDELVVRVLLRHSRLIEPSKGVDGLAYVGTHPSALNFSLEPSRCWIYFFGYGLALSLSLYTR